MAGTYTINPDGFSDLMGWVWDGSAYSYFSLPSGDSFYINILSLNNREQIVTTVQNDALINDSMSPPLNEAQAHAEADS